MTCHVDITSPQTFHITSLWSAHGQSVLWGLKIAWWGWDGHTVSMKRNEPHGHGAILCLFLEGILGNVPKVGHRAVSYMFVFVVIACIDILTWSIANVACNWITELGQHLFIKNLIHQPVAGECAGDKLDTSRFSFSNFNNTTWFMMQIFTKWTLSKKPKNQEVNISI